MEYTRSDSHHHLSNTSSLNWFSFRRELTTIVATTGSIYDATDTLLATNNRHGAQRCTGALKLIDGVPSLSYCGRWHCWKCGKTRLWNERRRLQHGAEQIAAAGTLWFTTVYDSGARRSLDAIDFQARLSRLLDTWRKKAQRDGVALQYATVYGFKPTTGAIHAHILSNWLPTPFSAPTPHHHHHHRDAWLDGRAALDDLTLWHERAYSVEGVANYSANNLRSVLRVGLPSNFQRLVYSRHFPKLPSVPVVTGDTLADYAIANFGAVVDQQPIYKYTQTNGTRTPFTHTAHSDATETPPLHSVSNQDGDTQHTADRRRAHTNSRRVDTHVNKLAFKLLAHSRHHAKTDNSGRRRTAKETFDATPQIRVPP